MHLTSLRVRNYRTVGAVEQTLPLDGGLTIVGPNNSGKSNLLRAVELLFTGLDNAQGYLCATDLTFGDKSVKTALLASFDGDDTPGSLDAQIYDQLDQLHAILGTVRSGSAFTLSLQFTASSTPVYQFFPNAKQPASNATRTQFSRTQRQLVTDLVDRFACHYVPSARNFRELHEDLLVPFLRASVADALEPYAREIQDKLSDAAKAINADLAQAGLGHLNVSFSMPNNSLEDLLHRFDFHLEDPEKTTIFMKGQGIQSTTMLAGLLWMTEQEVAQGKSVIWLLEEPESYLHPELSNSALKLLDGLGRKSLTVSTTHSLTFVPQDPTRVVGTSMSNGRTAIETYSTYVEATQRLRSALGVRFSDYFNLGRFNLLLEGQSDRILIEWLLGQIPETVHAWPRVRSAHLLDFGGVKHLAGFLRASYPMIQAERATVAVFDGDAAGVKERGDLQRYFGQKQVSFEPNLHFLSVRNGFAIEGLFPDEWILDLHQDHPNWFDEYSVDVSGDLESYRFKDHNKSAAQNSLVRRAEEADDLLWAARWIDLCEAAEAALERLDRWVRP